MNGDISCGDHVSQNCGCGIALVLGFSMQYSPGSRIMSDAPQPVSVAVGSSPYPIAVLQRGK